MAIGIGWASGGELLIKLSQEDFVVSFICSPHGLATIFHTAPALSNVPEESGLLFPSSNEIIWIKNTAHRFNFCFPSSVTPSSDAWPLLPQTFFYSFLTGHFILFTFSMSLSLLSSLTTFVSPTTTPLSLFYQLSSSFALHHSSYSSSSYRLFLSHGSLSF